MPIPDPFQQQHERLGEEAFKKVTQRADQWAQREQLIQQSIVWHLFGWGLIGNLWKYSKTALFLYVIPAFVGLFGVGLGFVAGNVLQGAPAGLFYLFSIFSLFVVAASMAYGYYKAPRIGRLFANAYFVCVCVFWIVWLLTHHRCGIYFLIGRLSILGMLICFLSTVATEVWGMFHNRRQPME